MSRFIKSYLALGLVATIFYGCSSFPSDVHSTSYFKLLQKSQKYYRVLSSSVFSRAIAIQPESIAWSEIERVKTHWEQIDSIQTGQKIVEYLKKQEISVLAARVDQALKGAEVIRPADAKKKIEAVAIKQGLLEAYHRLASE